LVKPGVHILLKKIEQQNCTTKSTIGHKHKLTMVSHKPTSNRTG
jgi:hypothetical protein